VIICEDEPYYCLFAGKWTPQKHQSQQSVLAKRQEELEKSEGKDGNEAFLKALPPTFLTVDYEGRVIRMDVSGLSHYNLSSNLSWRSSLLRSIAFHQVVRAYVFRQRLSQSPIHHQALLPSAHADC